MATFFTQNEITEKNNVLLVITVILLLILGLFMLKFNTLIGVISCLGCIIIAGVSTIIFVS